MRDIQKITREEGHLRFHHIPLPHIQVAVTLLRAIVQDQSPGPGPDRLIGGQVQ